MLAARISNGLGHRLEREYASIAAHEFRELTRVVADIRADVENPIPWLDPLAEPSVLSLIGLEIALSYLIAKVKPFQLLLEPGRKVAGRSA
jgi:hypothetical protein